MGPKGKSHLANTEASLMMQQSNGKRSVLLSGKISTTWEAFPIESSGKEMMSNCTKDDGNVGIKAISPRRVSKRMQKQRKINDGGEGANADQFAAVRTEMVRFTGCIDPKNRGRRSVRRPRGNIPASWGSAMDGLQSFELVVVSKLGKNVQEAVSKKMESSQGADTASSCNASENAAKVEQIDVAMVDTLADVKESIGADASEWSGAPLAAPAENGTDQTAWSMIPDTSFEVKGSNGADANAVTDTTAELKVSNGASANFAVQANAQTTSTVADLKESNGEMADAPVKSAVQTTDAVDPQQVRANDAEFDFRASSGLDLSNGDCSVDLSSAESSLTSLYGQYDRDSCIEFAVKLLMNEIPLPKDAEKVEEFFCQKMNAKRA